jgi:hypothetical protein
LTVFEDSLIIDVDQQQRVPVRGAGYEPEGIALRAKPLYPIQIAPRRGQWMKESQDSSPTPEVQTAQSNHQSQHGYHHHKNQYRHSYAILSELVNAL